MTANKQHPPGGVGAVQIVGNVKGPVPFGLKFLPGNLLVQ